MNKRQHDKMVGDVDNMICLGAYNLRVACRPHVTDSVGDKVFDLCDAAMRDALSGKRPKGLVVGTPSASHNSASRAISLLSRLERYMHLHTKHEWEYVFSLLNEWRKEKVG